MNTVATTVGMMAATWGPMPGTRSTTCGQNTRSVVVCGQSANRL